MNARLWIRPLLLLLAFVISVLFFINGNVFVGLGMHIIGCIYIFYGTLNPSFRFFGPIITQIETPNSICLSIDDGPDPHNTPAILDLLGKHQAKAMFFLIGEKAVRYPELVKEIHRRGHEIGNHSWSHPRATFWMLGPVRTYREIAKCQNVIREIIGITPRYFRAPVGHFNFFVHPVLKHLGMQLVGWNCRGYDGVASSFHDVSQRIRRTATSGSIILAHEGTPIAEEVISDILKLAEEQQWQCIIPNVSQRLDNC